MKKYLLIISCSGAKDETPGRLPAIQRYGNGPFFPTLRKARRKNYFPKTLDVLIISAKYGLLELDEKIETYNEEMDDKRVKELRPIIQEKLKSFLDGKYYDQLFNGSWNIYQETLEGFDWDRYRREDVEVESNRFKRVGQAKKWIKELFKEEQGE